MNAESNPKPSDVAEDAKRTGREALSTAQGYAQEAGDLGRDAATSIRANAQDAKQVGREAAATAGAYVDEAKELGSDAVDSARGYAQQAGQTAKEALKSGKETAREYTKNVVNTASRKFDDLKGQVDVAKQRSTQYIADEPVRAVLIAAAGGALLTALLIAATRPSRRYYED